MIHIDLLLLTLLYFLHKLILFFLLPDYQATTIACTFKGPFLAALARVSRTTFAIARVSTQDEHAAA